MRMIGCSVVIGALRRCTGNAAVEFALIAPVLAATLVAMTDLGIGLYSKMQVENAAQAGAQYAIAKGWNSAAIQNAVTSASALASVGAVPAPVQSCGCVNGTAITAAACGSLCPGGVKVGTYVTVSAQASYSTLFSYPGLSSPMTLTGQSTVRIQ
jgi:Flp pilus assembly protein TadG